MAALNKQTLINLLIDSPLREPIKINLIDIVNNTSDADLPKTYSTIAKELEIFQKATERRMKLAEETVAKLQADGGAASDASPAPQATPTDLPPLPTPQVPPTPATAPTEDEGLVAPKLDLPPLPTPPSADVAPEPISEPAPAPVEPATPDTASSSSDEDALKEIQKELDALKGSAAQDAA